jgi:DNA-binding response OmpR family regulator
MAQTALVVEDDPKYLAFVSRTLRRAGFGVETAGDGSAVSELLSSQHFDVLVLDLQMPGMNGWEVMRWLRGSGRMCTKEHRDEPPKVVVVSGRDESETVDFVRRLGADAYLTKPLLGHELVSTVRQVLAK